MSQRALDPSRISPTGRADRDAGRWRDGQEQAVDLSADIALPSASSTWRLITRLTEARSVLSLWLLAGALDLLISEAGGGYPLTPVRVLVTYGVGYGLSLVACRVVLREAHRVGDFSLVRMIAVALPCGAVLFLVDVSGRAIAHGHSPFEPWPSDFVLRTRINLAYFMMLFAFQVTIAWLMTSAQELQLREHQLLETQLSALRLQLSPHFLLNTLNAILALVSDKRTSEAEAMIMRLAFFFERSLVDAPALLVPLAAEIDMVQAYLDIESIRFGDRMSVSYACDAELTDAQVPSFILQPLVENAVKYAVAPSKETVSISIEATTEEGTLLLRVVDDGSSKLGSDGIPGTGLGLRNVAARLSALYGPSASIKVTRRDAGFSADLRIPLVREAG